HFVDVKLGWDSAESDCVAWGGHLVSITDAKEEAFIDATFIATINAEMPDGGGNSGVWIGADDKQGEGMVGWSDGDPFTFTDWGVKEPNDTNHTKNCVFLAAPFHKWNDYECTVNGTYLCERP